MTAHLSATEADGPAPAPAALRDPGFGATVGSEWIKLRTARTPRRNLVLGVILAIGLSLLLALAVASTFDEWSAAEQATFDPVVYPLSGGLFTAIFFAAVGVNVMSSEHSSQMLRLTLAATPRRGRVVAAKALVVALATAVAGLVAGLGMLLGTQPIFASGDLPTAGLGDADLRRTLIAVTLVGPIYPVLAVAAATVLRGTAAALSTVLALIFIPGMLGGLLPDWWQRNVLSLLPGPASDSLALAHLDDSPMYLAPWAAVLVCAAWVVGSLVGARWVLQRRDP